MLIKKIRSKKKNSSGLSPNDEFGTEDIKIVLNNSNNNDNTGINNNNNNLNPNDNTGINNNNFDTLPDNILVNNTQNPNSFVLLINNNINTKVHHPSLDVKDMKEMETST